MKHRRNLGLDMPSAAQIEKELRRVRNKRRFRQALRSTISALVVVAALAVLAAVLLPVMQIYGNSMNPTLREGDIVLSLKGMELERGDLVSFYLGNKLLVKRFIAGAGQWVDIDEDGVVYVDGERLEEPYVEERALGDLNITLPYQVPEGRIFVLGDHRGTSVDSRNTAVGCVAEEQIVGKVFLRVWPLEDLGPVERQEAIPNEGG